MNAAIRAILLIVILVAASGGIVYIFNSDEISTANRENLVITPDTFAGTSEIELGRVVEITGTPDLLNAATLFERNSDKVIAYYVPLKEYGTNFVVEIDRSRLSSEQQTFIGEVDGINKTEYEKRIKTVLNKPVELTDDDRAELDPETIETLLEETTQDFPNKALLVFDGQVPQESQVLSNVVFWSVILSVLLITLFRRVIFRDIFF